MLFITSEPEVAPEISDIAATRNDIRFVWNDIPCEQRGGNITTYEFELKKGKTNEEWEPTNEKTNVTRTYKNFSKLAPCSTYEFRVRAYTSAGPGPWGKKQQDTATIGK